VPLVKSTLTCPRRVWKDSVLGATILKGRNVPYVIYYAVPTVATSPKEISVAGATGGVSMGGRNVR